MITNTKYKVLVVVFVMFIFIVSTNITTLAQDYEHYDCSTRVETEVADGWGLHRNRLIVYKGDIGEPYQNYLIFYEGDELRLGRNGEDATVSPMALEQRTDENGVTHDVTIFLVSTWWVQWHSGWQNGAWEFCIPRTDNPPSPPTVSLQLVPQFEIMHDPFSCFSNFVSFDYRGGEVYLSSSPNMLTSFAVDDVLDIEVTSIAWHETQTFVSNTQDIQPTNIAHLLKWGPNIISVNVTSSAPPMCGSSEIWLVNPTFADPLCEGDTSPMHPGDVETYICTIAASYQWARGTVFLGSDANISLISPSGTVYDASSPDADSARTDTQVSITVPTPEIGDWQVVITALETDANGTSFYYIVEGFNEAPDDNPAETHQTICHMPPGNPDNPHTITIGVSAVPAHLAHGDTLGACPENAQPGNRDQGNSGNNAGGNGGGNAGGNGGGNGGGNDGGNGGGNAGGNAGNNGGGNAGGNGGGNGSGRGRP